MNQTHGFQQLVKSRMSVLYFSMPSQIHVFQSPNIFEFRPGGLTSNRSGVVVIRVKRRVQVNQIHGFIRHSTQDFKIVSGEDGAVLYHAASSLYFNLLSTGPFIFSIGLINVRSIFPSPRQPACADPEGARRRGLRPRERNGRLSL